MGSESNYTSASTGGIKRGDRAETGDLEARPSDGVSRAGSGVHGGGGGAEGHVTADPSSLGTEGPGATELVGTPLHTGDTELDELTVMDAADPNLGLTNVGDIPPDDWAADTGPTHSGEADAPSRRS